MQGKGMSNAAEEEEYGHYGKLVSRVYQQPFTRGTYMPTYDQLDYEPLLKDKGTRSAIVRAKSQAVHRAGPTRPIQVKPYSEVDESAEPLVATAVLSKDGVWLDAPFTMPDSTHGFCAYDYQELTTKIAGFK